MSIDETPVEIDGVTAEGVAYLRRLLAQSRKTIASLSNTVGSQSTRLQKAEMAEREMARDRDHWRSRAKALEAKLKSHGIDPDTHP